MTQAQSTDCLLTETWRTLVPGLDSFTTYPNSDNAVFTLNSDEISTITMVPPASDATTYVEYLRSHDITLQHQTIQVNILVPSILKLAPQINLIWLIIPCYHRLHRCDYMIGFWFLHFDLHSIFSTIWPFFRNKKLLAIIFSTFTKTRFFFILCNFTFLLFFDISKILSGINCVSVAWKMYFLKVLCSRTIWGSNFKIIS